MPGYEQHLGTMLQAAYTAGKASAAFRSPRRRNLSPPGTIRVTRPPKTRGAPAGRVPDDDGWHH